MRMWSGILFVMLFAAMLAVPAAVTMYRIAGGAERSRSDVERRSLETVSTYMADLSAGRVPMRDAGSRFGEAYKDQLAFRVPVTRFVNRLFIGLFRHSPNETVKIGRDNFWFQTGAPSFRFMACAAPEDVNRARAVAMLDSYKTFEARAAAKGVKTYLLVVPLTQMIYPENLPTPLRQHCEGRSVMRDLLDEAGEGGRIAYDLDWFRAQAPGDVFDPRAFHWHGAGAQKYLAYLIEDGILKGERRQPRLGRERVRTDDVDNAADMGVAPLHSKAPYRALRERAQTALTGAELSPEEAAAFADIVRKGRERTLKITRGGPQPGVGVLVGDSFSAKFWLSYAHHFETAYRFHTSFLDLREGVLDRIIETTDPDYLVVLLIEPKWTILDHSGEITSYERMFLAAP